MVGPLIQYYWCPYERVNMATDLRTGRMQCEDEDRDQSNSSEAKECQRLTANYQKLEKKSMELILLYSPWKEATLATP